MAKRIQRMVINVIRSYMTARACARSRIPTRRRLICDRKPSNASGTRSFIVIATSAGACGRLRPLDELPRPVAELRVDPRSRGRILRSLPRFTDHLRVSLAQSSGGLITSERLRNTDRGHLRNAELGSAVPRKGASRSLERAVLSRRKQPRVPLRGSSTRSRSHFRAGRLIGAANETNERDARKHETLPLSLALSIPAFARLISARLRNRANTIAASRR